MEMQKCRTVNSCLNDKELAALISSKKADGVGDVTFNQINANADTKWSGPRDAPMARENRATPPPSPTTLPALWILC